MRLKRSLFSLCLVLGLAAVPLASATVYAANVDPFKQACGRYAADDPAAPAVCKEKRDLRNPDGSLRNPLFGPEGILTRIISILSIVVGIAAVIGIMEGGLKFIRSGDNPEQVSSARGRVINCVVALILAASAQAIVHFILNRIE